MTVKRFFELCFHMWFPNKALEKLKATPDRTPDVLRLLWQRSQGSESVSLKLLSRIQKIEHKLDKLEKGE